MTLTLQKGFTLDGAAIASSSAVSVTAGAVYRLDAEALSIGTNTLVAASFPYANIKAYILLSSTDCTVKTNSSGSPTDTITLSAGVPKTFITGGETTSLFTGNVTAFYVTNAAATTLTVCVAYDPTP